MDEKDHVELCCRSLHKCDTFKHIELNYTNESNIRHCDCEYLFKTCLTNLNSSLSIELSNIHAINARKCYAKNYPIIKCAKLRVYSEPKNLIFESMNLPERLEFSSRCEKYEMDQSQPQKIQMFDLLHNFYGEHLKNGK